MNRPDNNVLLISSWMVRCCFNIPVLVYASLVLTLCAVPVQLNASGILMGRLMTVRPYGAQDTARNPALLSFQDRSNSIGVTADYSTSPSVDFNITHILPVVQKIDLDRYNGGSARISYARTINPVSLGFDYYFNNETSKIRQKNFVLKGDLVAGQGFSSENKMSHLFTFSMSSAVDPAHAIGFRLNCSYFTNGKKDTSHLIQVSATPVYVHSSERTTIEQVSTLPGIGYFGKINMAEIGLMVTAGRFTWKKLAREGFSYFLTSLLAQPLFKAKGSIPFTYACTMGPSILAGFSIKPSFNYSAGLEIEVSVPVSYRESYLIQSEALLSPYTRFHYLTSDTFGLKNRVSIKPSVSVRGGWDFTISRTSVFTIGAGFCYNTVPSSSTGLTPAPMDTYYTDYTVISLQGTAGFDLFTGKNCMISIGATATYFSLLQKLSLLQSISSSFNKLEMKTVSIDLAAAASIGF